MKERVLPAAALALFALFAPTAARAPQNPVKEVGDGFKRMGETLSRRLPKAAPSTDPGAEPARDAGPSRGAQWYTLSNGEFTLDMPGAPEHSRTGRPHAEEVYRVRAGGVDYLLRIKRVRGAHASQASREQSLKGHVREQTSRLVEESARQGMKAEVTFERDLRLGSVPGQQYRVSTGGRNGVIRFYATGSHIYTIHALGGATADATVAEFLDSFRIGRR